jgi:hypothetical protein
MSAFWRYSSVQNDIARMSPERHLLYDLLDPQFD